MAAVVNVYSSTGTTEGSPAPASAEGGIKFNKDATLTGTTAPITVPTATGTAFSWHKNLYLYVVSGGGSTSLSNRKVRLNGAPATGLKVHFKATASYAQPAAAAADAGSNAATPAGYTDMTTSDQTYDADSEAAANTTRNGDIVQVSLGVDNNYVSGASSNATVPSIIFSYDEA